MQYAYDSAGRVANATADGQTVYYSYESRDRLTTTTDAGGRSVVFGYDGAGRQTSVTDPMGNTAYMDYDTSGQLWRVREAAAGRLWRVRDGSPETSVTVEYDFWGRPVKLSDQRGKAWTAQYDAEGRVTTETNPLGKSSAWTYLLRAELTS